MKQCIKIPTGLKR